MHDGPALGVEEAFAGGFVAERRIVPGLEELPLPEPSPVLQQLDVTGDGLADDPAFAIELRGRVELGKSFFEPEGAAGTVVFEEGVDHFVRDGAFAVGEVPAGDDPILIGAGLVETSGIRGGAEGGEKGIGGEEYDAEGKDFDRRA